MLCEPRICAWLEEKLQAFHLQATTTQAARPAAGRILALADAVAEHLNLKGLSSTLIQRAKLRNLSRYSSGLTREI